MYYGMNMPYYQEEYVSRAETLQDLLLEAMKDERHDRVKYKDMMDMTKDEKVRRQIQFAYDDEGKHYQMFQQIARAIYKRPLQVETPQVEKYDNLKDAVESSINGELDAVELYRKIMSMMPNMKLRDMMFEIITDEQEHASRFIYLNSLLSK